MCIRDRVDVERRAAYPCQGVRVVGRGGCKWVAECLCAGLLDTTSMRTAGASVSDKGRRHPVHRAPLRVLGSALPEGNLQGSGGGQSLVPGGGCPCVSRDTYDKGKCLVYRWRAGSGKEILLGSATRCVRRLGFPMETKRLPFTGTNV